MLFGRKKRKSVKLGITKKTDTYPKCTRKESNHTTRETWFLAFGRDTFIHTFTKPYICFHVPSVKEELEVGSKLDLHDFNVGRAVPLWFTFSIEACKAKASEDTGTLRVSKNTLNKCYILKVKKHVYLGECPDSVIFGSFNWSSKLK